MQNITADLFVFRPIKPAVAALSLLCLLILGGCGNNDPAPAPRVAADEQLFGPVEMHLDTFSKIKDWDHTGSPQGVEALVEFDDRFGDRIKAAGTILFELYEYRPYNPDHRGGRIANPWTGSLITYDQQKTHWEGASGAYLFRLSEDKLAWNRKYVLTAIYESPTRVRMFSSIIITSHAPEPISDSTQP